MKKIFSILLLFVLSFSFSQFKLPQKMDWEIAKTIPIVILQLDESDENASVYNTSIKKYAEEFFGADRIEKYLSEKEFKKFIKGNKEKYNFIGFEYNKRKSLWFTQLYFGITGKVFMINNGFLMSYNYNLDEEKSTFFKSTFQIISEADIKFVLGTFKSDIESGIEKGDVSLKSLMKESKDVTLKDLNPNSAELKDLNLLIDKDLVDDNFINQFKNEYKFKYELVDRNRIESAILSNEKGVAFTYEYYKPLAGKTKTDNFETSYYAIMLYIYKAEDYSQLFSYIPDMSIYGTFSNTKSVSLVDYKDYVSKLNSVIE